jgi:hypothetical protein
MWFANMDVDVTTWILMWLLTWTLTWLLAWMCEVAVDMDVDMAAYIDDDDPCIYGPILKVAQIV